MKNKACILAIGVAIAGTLALSGCGDKYNEPFKDGPRNGTDRGAAKVVEMPDGFSNVAYKCLAGTHLMMGVVYHGDNKYGTVAMVLDPQDCP